METPGEPDEIKRRNGVLNTVVNSDVKTNDCLQLWP